MSTTVNTSTNTVTISEEKSSVLVTNNNTGTSVDVTGIDAPTVTIASPGPRGPKGDDGSAGSVSDYSGTLSGDNLNLSGHITASGNISASGTGSFGVVGIGTSPATSLHIKDEGGASSGGLRFENAYDQVGMYFQNNNNDSTFVLTYVGTSGPDIQLQADGDIILNGNSSTGNVGIGTSTPGEALEVIGNISASGNINVTGHISASGHISSSGKVYAGDGLYHSKDISEETYIGFPTGDKIYAVAGGVNFMYAWQKDADVNKLIFNEDNTDTDIVFRSADGSNNKLLYLDASEHKIGINTGFPEELLHISSSDDAIIQLETSAFNKEAGVYFDTHRSGSGMGKSKLYKSGSQTYWSLDASLIWNSNGMKWMQGSNQNMMIYSSSAENINSTEYVRFEHETRRVGIGTSTPAEALTVEGNISASGGFHVSSSGVVTVGANQKLYLNKTEDTYIQSMTGDIARVVAGGNQMIIWDYDTGNRAVFGNGTKVYIGNNNNAIPTHELEINGEVSASGAITASNLQIDGASIDFTGLPTSDPSVTGRLWNSASYLRISAG